MNSGSFFDVPRTNLSITTGEVELPILYYKVSSITFLFAVNYEKAEKMFRVHGFRPGLRWGKQAVVALAFYEYRETSIGPYNEVGLAIPVLMQHQRAPFSSWLDLYSNLETRRTGIFIIDLPVTTEIAWAFRKPNFKKTLFVSGCLAGIRIPVNKAFEGKPVRFTSLKKNSRGVLCSVVLSCQMTSAPKLNNGGAVSAAGEALQRFPPTVPILRIRGLPNWAEALARHGVFSRTVAACARWA